jgi:hypothetical protein
LLTAIWRCLERSFSKNSSTSSTVRNGQATSQHKKLCPKRQSTCLRCIGGWPGVLQFRSCSQLP